jgi:hypothetical protein
LAGQSGLAKQTILKQLTELCNKGWLIRELVFDKTKGQRPSKYTATIPESVENQIIGGNPERPPSISKKTPQYTQKDTNSSLNSTVNRKDQNTRGRFTPPCVDDVREYCNSRGNQIDPEEFIDHYQANGWMRGKNKIKDWKACVRTWEKNREKNQSVHDRRAEQSAENLARARAAAERLSRWPVPEDGSDLRTQMARPIPKPGDQ